MVSQGPARELLEVVQIRASQIQEWVAGLRIGRVKEVRGLTVFMGLSLYQEGEGAEEMMARALSELRAHQAEVKPQ